MLSPDKKTCGEVFKNLVKKSHTPPFFPFLFSPVISMLKRQSVLASVGLFLLIFISIIYVYTSETKSDTHIIQQNEQQSTTAPDVITSLQGNNNIIMDAMGNETERYIALV